MGSVAHTAASMPASINSLNVIMALINSELDEQSRDFSTKQLGELFICLFFVLMVLDFCFFSFR